VFWISLGPWPLARSVTRRLHAYLFSSVSWIFARFRLHRMMMMVCTALGHFLGRDGTFLKFAHFLD
jgi:hypothetical protein